MNIENVFERFITLEKTKVDIFFTEPRYNRPDIFLPYLFSLGVIRAPSLERTSLPQIQHTERTGPFKTWYYWKQLDFAYPSEKDRDAAIIFKDFIPRHNLPLGKKIFLTEAVL